MYEICVSLKHNTRLTPGWLTDIVEPKLSVKCASVVSKLSQTVPALCLNRASIVPSLFILCANAQKLLFQRNTNLVYFHSFSWCTSLNASLQFDTNMASTNTRWRFLNLKPTGNGNYFVKFLTRFILFGRLGRTKCISNRDFWLGYRDRIFQSAILLVKWTKYGLLIGPLTFSCNEIDSLPL